MKSSNLLSEILSAKEQRVKKQEEFLKKYKTSLLSLSINIPGAIKCSLEARYIFHVSLEEIEKIPFTFLEKRLTCNLAGYEAIYVFNLDAYELKMFTCKLEDTHPLGRFIDLDVIDKKGKIISRKELGFEPRKCFLCSQDAKVCARSRTHKIEELLEFIVKRVDDYTTSL
jgi:holo-ACP synthase CitX